VIDAPYWALVLGDEDLSDLATEKERLQILITGVINHLASFKLYAITVPFEDLINLP
jgi:hypothetical protein